MAPDAVVDGLPPLVVAHLALDADSGEDGVAWARGLAAHVDVLRRRWSVAAFDPIGESGNDGSGSWVAAVTLADGGRAVLKLGFPHVEGRDEIDGLAFWAGEPTVRLLASDRERNAMLLERCEPGRSLSTRPALEQDEVVADLLRRLWRSPPAADTFRPLAELAGYLRDCRSADVAGDAGLGRALAELDALAAPTPADRVLATDLHARNVLLDDRAGWRVVDPKPYVGDPAFDVTQHLLNCPARLRDDPSALIGRMAALAGVDAARVRRWLAARLVVEGDLADRTDLADIVRACR